MASIPVWVFSLIILLVCYLGYQVGFYVASKDKKGQCWHHNDATGQTWISGQLIDLGRRKMYTCSQCGKKWFT